MGIVNFTYLQKFSGILRWLADSGTSVKSTTLSDTTTAAYCWGVDGDFFFTASSYSTGRIEKWARDGTAYTWRRTGIDTFGSFAMAADSSDNLYVCKQDDIYILGASDGLTDYSDIGNELSGYNPGKMAVDSSGNCYILMAGTTDTRLFKFDNTLTKSWETQVIASSQTIYGLELDSSGNCFVAYGSHLEKFNSSGTSQWDHSPTSGSVSDVKVANGKIYGCSNQYVFRLTDNGATVTEDWEVDIGTDYSFYAWKIAVSADQILCFPQSGSWDIHAIEEADGDEDTTFTSYDVTNEILIAYNDPLATITVGAFEVTEEIQYSRWVKTEGDIECGHFVLTEGVTVRGYGNVLIDKLALMGNYSYIGSPTPRYENMMLVGDPPSEEWSYKAYQYQTSTYPVKIDINGNMYTWCYRAYTAQEADDASDGYYTSAGSYWSIHKVDSDGDFVWESDIRIGTLKFHDVDQDGEYIYVATGYTSGAITKISCATGVEYTDTNWPIDITDISDTLVACQIGRDNKLYIVLDDASNSYDQFLYKYDLDGTTSTNWSTPYTIPTPVGYSRSVWDIDINASGDVAIGCRKASESGDALEVVDASKTQVYTVSFGVDNVYGAEEVLIDDDGVVLAQSYSGIEKIPADGSAVNLIITKSSSTGAGYLYNSYWSSEGNQDYFYGCSSFISSNDTSIHKYKFSDGSEEWVTGGNDDTALQLAGIHPKQAAAWGITVTFGSDGVVKTYFANGSDSGTELTTGDVVYAEAGKDFRFAFLGDTGYYVDEVTIDSVNIGYAPDYTFTNVLNNHTIHVTFGTGFPSGPFTMTHAITGGILDTVNVGAFEETYSLHDPVLSWTIGGGPFTETYAIRGEGYLPFDITLLYLINAERSDNAVASVVEDPRGWLLDGAEYAVADMIANGSLTLSAAEIMGQDGANYPYLYAGIIPSILDVSFTAQELFDAWMLDPPTAALIINSDYEEIGIYVEEYDGDNYVCAVFAQWHPQYTAIRADEHFDVEWSVPTTYFFNFLSQAEYEKFVANNPSNYSPTYTASIGSYEITDIISFTYILETGKKSYMTLVVPYEEGLVDAIESRTTETIVIDFVWKSGGVETTRSLVSVNFESLDFLESQTSQLTISGWDDLRYYQVDVTITEVSVRTVDVNGKIRLRCVTPDFYLRPGCTIHYGTDTFVVGKIYISVSERGSQFMEIYEE